MALLVSGCQSAPDQARALKPSSPNWEKDIAAFEASDRSNPPPAQAILFIGSSSIRMWRSLAADFPQHRVINRGFGGSQIVDSAYYAPRIVLPYRPAKIVIYAGGNDINAGKAPQQVLHDFQQFTETVRRRLPRTEIYFISIAPNPARWSQIERVREANDLIRKYSRRKQGVSFIDVHSAMLSDQGRPREGIYLDDKLHMNEKGYAIWRQIIGRTLAE